MRTSFGMLRAACCCSLLWIAACGSRDADRAAAAAHGSSLGGMAAGPSPHVAPPVPELEAIFGAKGSGVAWVEAASGKLHVVHDGRTGRLYDDVESIVLSPDGRRVAYGALAGAKWCVVVDGKEGPAFDAVREPAFSPDGKHVAYLAKAGEAWHVVVDARVRAASPRPGSTPEFNAASNRVAFIDGADALGWGRLVVSDLAFKKEITVDARASGLVVDPSRRRLAAASANGDGRAVVILDFDRPDRAQRGAGRDDVRQLTFGPGGQLAYLAERAGRISVVLDGREEPIAPDDRPVTPPVVRPDGGAVGLFVLSRGSVTLRQYFATGATSEGGYDAAEGLVYGSDARSLAYVAQKGEKWFLVANGKEGLPLDRAVSPAFSRDGRYLVYRARTGASRFVVVADRDGKTISIHRGYEQVYPVVFAADGKSVTYGVRENGAFAWKSERL